MAFSLSVSPMRRASVTSSVTRIRSHEKIAAKPCKRILGYDANALYLSTMLNDMRCGKEKVTDYEDPVLAAIELKNAIINGKLVS